MTWWLEAACRGMDSDIFFADRGGNDRTREARKVCAVCPVRDECLAFAQRNFIDHGVYGGHGPKERIRLRRKSRVA